MRGVRSRRVDGWDLEKCRNARSLQGQKQALGNSRRHHLFSLASPLTCERETGRKDSSGKERRAPTKGS